MKVLFDHPNPFFLAHGGFQIQIDQTKEALQGLGVSVEFVRWWDERQSGDLIHYFGRPTVEYIQMARQQKFKVVMTNLLGGLAARSGLMRVVQWGAIRLARSTLPMEFTARLAWDAFKKADACIALTGWEAHLMKRLFSAPREKVHVIPNGVEEVFLQSSPAKRGRWLVCTATITAIKRVAELARAAVAANTPVWIIGKPYSETDPYAQGFLKLSEQHSKVIRYEGPIYDRAKLAQVYRESRGFVLLSRWETLSLSALEAAACACPILVSDLPWARSFFGEQVRYCPLASTARTARVLRHFYDDAPNLPATSKAKGWPEVAQQLTTVYSGALSSPW
jgi:glycosyltransferase involved in cell wall biosynthesis